MEFQVNGLGAVSKALGVEGLSTEKTQVVQQRIQLRPGSNTIISGDPWMDFGTAVHASSHWREVSEKRPEWQNGALVTAFLEATQVPVMGDDPAAAEAPNRQTFKAMQPLDCLPRWLI